jgi:1,2-phenylacetyl-CoA epoxidase PaaB subunit
MDEIVFDVFARKSRGDPLAHIGYLQAPDRELARVYAWNTYDEESWFEMCVVRRSDILPVNRADGPFVRGAVGDEGEGGAR